MTEENDFFEPSEGVPVKKKLGRPRKDNKDYSKSLTAKDFVENDELLSRPARRPSKAEQKIREELLREELRRMNGNKSRYFIVSVVINHLSISSYKSVSFECKESFFSQADLKKVLGNPENYAILSILEIDKDDFDIFNSRENKHISETLGLIK